MAKPTPEEAAASLDALTMGQGGTGLKVDDHLAAAPTPLREALDRALRDPQRASARAIALTLTKAGYQTSASAVKNWRKHHLGESGS